MQNVPVNSYRGYTLTELVIVTALIALFAAAAIPSINSSESKELDLAAAQFAAAIRFARSESIRTGEPHGFRHESSDTDRIRVFRADTTQNPWDLIYDVYHPVDKQLYDIDLAQQTIASATSVVRNTVFIGTCSQTGRVHFDGSGTPWCGNPTSVLLESYEIDMQLGTMPRKVRLDGITGRVTVQ
jgi:type II secretion system protein H